MFLPCESKRKEHRMTQKKTPDPGPDLDLNLSDFALFLAVMKNPRAHECVLSLIMGEPDLKLKQVRVEEVILNQLGQRSIRLDAWAADETGRQFSTEMQNDTETDDVRRRSRYYQGLMDSPILKSGKKTRYRHLPSTVIIFITQEDIFGQDRAMYTFTEQCEEVSGLHLEDGTRKIFLNMSSRNGRPELVSLLQYMKDSRLENPAVTVKDPRIVELDAVVSEVKQSEEWEEAKMSILSVGIERGRAEGRARGRIEGRAAGNLEGKRESILALLGQLGPVPEELKAEIMAQADTRTLTRWLVRMAIQNFSKNPVISMVPGLAG